MLDVGFSELLLTAVVALVVVGPKDLPVMLRALVRGWRQVRAFYRTMHQQFEQVIEVSGIESVPSNLTTILDLEGKPQIAYNVAELDHVHATTPVAQQTVGSSSPSQIPSP